MLALGVGVALVVIGLTPAEPAAAPLPKAAFSVSGQSARAAADSQEGAAPGTRGAGALGPHRLAVASLGIDAPLTAQELAGESLVIPGDPRTVGWWSGGAALDAAAGTTLLAGHVDRDGRLGALHDLYRITPGASVVTTDANGRESRWRVVSLEARPKTDLPEFSASGPRRLAIVTCGGAVVRTEHGTGYADNVIVVAEPEAPPRAASQG